VVYDPEQVFVHGYVVSPCPLPGHVGADLTFAVHADNSWECVPCGKRGGAYELWQLTAEVEEFQLIWRGFATGAGIDLEGLAPRPILAREER
jgi:hypothetical protein